MHMFAHFIPVHPVNVQLGLLSDIFSLFLLFFIVDVQTICYLLLFSFKKLC